MKKPPNAFITVVIVLIFLFIFLGKMMKRAESDLSNLKSKREKEGGVTNYEKEVNALLQ